MRGQSYCCLIMLIWCYAIFSHFDFLKVEAFPVLSSHSQCQTTTVRKEWRDWTEGEQRRYFKALRKMNELGFNEGGVSVLDNFTKLHAEYNQEAHTHTLFLPWHRAFLREFEKSLQSIDPSLSLPYYNWAIDMSIYGSNILEQSSVMSLNAFGGTGSPLFDETGQIPIRGFEIVEGQLANWTVGYPERHLLRRELKYLEAVTEEELEKLILGSSDFQSFQERLDWPHAAFHQSFGADGTGDMGRLPTAPNDPIFFLHHAMIDYVWDSYQNQGTNTQKFHKDSNLNTILAPFKLTIADTLNSADSLCVKYQPLKNRPNAISDFTSAKHNGRKSMISLGSNTIKGMKLNEQSIRKVENEIRQWRTRSF